MFQEFIGSRCLFLTIPEGSRCFSMTSTHDRCSGSLRCYRMTTGSRSGSSPSRPRCWCTIGPEIWTKLFSFYNLQFLLSFNLFLWSNHYQNYFILLFKILFTLKSALQYKLLVWLCVGAGSTLKRFTVVLKPHNGITDYVFNRLIWSHWQSQNTT